MNIEWIAVETMAVLIEVFAFVYFLHSRFESKRPAMWPQLITWSAVVCWSLLATFLSLPLYDWVTHIALLIYLMIFKIRNDLTKILGHSHHGCHHNGNLHCGSRDRSSIDVFNSGGYLDTTGYIKVICIDSNKNVTGNRLLCPCQKAL
jgi:hypothetical protein